MIFGVTARPTSHVACELDLKKGSQKASNFGSAVFGRDVPGGDRRNVDGGTPGGVAAAAGAANDRVAGRSTAGSAGTAGGGAAAAGAANERWDAAAGVAAGVTATPCVDVTSKTDGGLGSPHCAGFASNDLAYGLGFRSHPCDNMLHD